MSASPATSFIPVDEYLANPAYEHAEYAGGRIEELNVGTKDHGKVQARCSKYFVDYFDKNPGGYVAAELHCRLKVRGADHFRLPDVVVVLGDEGAGRYLDRGPDLAIEIRSPEDSLTHLFSKFSEYFANGTKICWLVLPEESAVLVCLPDQPVRTAVRGDALDGGSVMPGLEIAVEDLFR